VTNLTHQFSAPIRPQAWGKYNVIYGQTKARATPFPQRAKTRRAWARQPSAPEQMQMTDAKTKQPFYRPARCTDVRLREVNRLLD
jgi:hypothetical protein